MARLSSSMCFYVVEHCDVKAISFEQAPKRGSFFSTALEALEQAAADARCAELAARLQVEKLEKRIQEEKERKSISSIECGF